MGVTKIFIVEDDEWYAEILQYHLSLNPDFEVQKFSNGKDCLKQLHTGPSIITIDYSLPDMTGKDLLKSIKNELPTIPVVVVSGQEDVSTAIGMLKEGAEDYIVKDEHTKDLLWNSIVKIKKNLELQSQVDHLRQEVEHKYDFQNMIIGNSSSMRKVFGLMEKAIGSNITVSVTGETGTGKEVVAKAIHYNSLRKKKPLVAVNVAAIPRELIESELFGHEKGAFTGADSKRIGKFEEANNGTIFLDEIGEMDLNMQAKLLRVLQEREVTRVGGSNQVKLDVRVIVATHKTLADEVRNGTFREDLYYRLLGLPIELPPLRERENDVLVLAKFFIDQFCKENKMHKISLSADAQKKVKQHPFRGNVRELKAVMELAVVMSNSQLIEANEISFNSSNRIDDIMMNEVTLKEYNMKIIQHFLNKYDQNVLKVADKLDIGKSTIYRMIKNGELDID